MAGKQGFRTTSVLEYFILAGEGKTAFVYYFCERCGRRSRRSPTLSYKLYSTMDGFDRIVHFESALLYIFVLLLSVNLLKMRNCAKKKRNSTIVFLL